ncbi:MAG: hypothetical protein ACOC1S_04025 [bacterium]
MKKNLLFKIFILLLFIFFSLSVPGQVQELDIDLNLGHNGLYFSGYYMPVTVTVKNEGDNHFSGELVIENEYQNLSDRQANGQDFGHIFNLEVPPDSAVSYRTSFFLFRDYFSPLTIKIRDEENVVWETEPELRTLRGHNQGYLVVGSSFPEFSREQTENEQPLVFTSPEYLPVIWTGYQGFPVIITQNIKLEELNQRQLEALSRWLLQGNRLFVGGNSSRIEENTEFIERNFPGVISGKVHTLPLESTHFNNTENYNLFSRDREEAKGLFVFNPGFLDDLTAEMFQIMPYWFPGMIMILGTLLLFCVFIFSLYYFFVARLGSLRYYFLGYIIVIIIFSIIFYTGAGKILIEKNHKVQEIAVIEKLPRASTATTESYFTFLSRKNESAQFKLDNENGSMSRLLPFYGQQFTGNLNLKGTPQQSVLFYEEQSDWLSGAFRAHYMFRLPIEYSGVLRDDVLELELKNDSSMNIVDNFLYYEDRWYQFLLPENNNKLKLSELSTGLDKLSGNRAGLQKNILQKIAREKFADRLSTDEEYAFIVSVIKGNRPQTGPEPEGSWQYRFTGFLLIPVEIKE